MRVAYLDAFSGLSGDMIVGALLDAGLEIADLERELAGIEIGGYRLRLESRERSGIRAAKFVVDIDDRHGARQHRHRHGGDHGHRRFADIRELIRESRLAPRVAELSLQVFARLAEAEGKVHGVDPEDVTFHEVGAIDSIVDIVGA
ncbi:MAG: nickel insertion protein, partial [Candidatus Binatia bacterium]